KAPMRNSGSRKALTQPPICASVSSSTRSTDYVGDVVHQRLGELQPLAHQPGTGPHQGGQHHQQARQEAQGLLVDLRGGLEHRHHQTGEQAGHHEDGHRHGGEPQGAAEQVDGDFRGHGYNVPKLAARVPMIRLQPSMSTNSMILNGSEMISGESIIIPMAIRILATTRSMIRNGMKIMKPIWKAVFSSEVTKAGTRMVSGVSAGVAMSVRLDSRTNRSRSLSRVCASMKSLSGTSARLMASLAAICSFRYGCSACSFTFSNTGAMINSVRNSARPSRIWL